jgi:hypothetical protein
MDAPPPRWRSRSRSTTRGASLAAPVHTITREIRLAHPMARLVPLFERCRALLDRWTLPAPVCGVAVAVVATAPLAGEQGDLLDPSWHDPAAADAAFARLRAELGAERSSSRSRRMSIARSAPAGGGVR